MVTVTGNIWPAPGTWTRYGITGLLAPSSFLEGGHLADDEAGTTYTIPNDVRSISVNFASTVPTITLPSIAFPGQSLRITLRNDSGGAWVGNYTFTGGGSSQARAGNVTNLGNGLFATHEFTAEDPENDGSYTWIGVYP
jgi:hypothetical protein